MKRLKPKHEEKCGEITICHFQKGHIYFCLPSKFLQKHCLQFLLGLRGNKHDADVKFWRENKEYFESGLLYTVFIAEIISHLSYYVGDCFSC